MKRFIDFLDEEYYENVIDLFEEADDPTREGGVSNNTKGVLHELLVGKFLNNGEHMKKHEDINKLSPQEVHDKLKAQIHPKDYARISEKAESAANHIRKTLSESHPEHKMREVVWTSKPGDTEKVTGVPATQLQDSSDIYVTTRHSKSGKVVHHGWSLKVSDKSNKEIPASSLGMKSSGSKAEQLFREHQKKIKEKYPELVGKNDVARKTWARENPEKHEDIRKANQELLKSVATEHEKELNDKLQSGNHEEVIDHIRNVLAAKTTPAEQAGKATFQKHTTYQTAKGPQHHTSKPGEDYEHILRDPNNISVKSSGASVHFYYKGSKFASQSQKFDSQSDPLSNLKSAGKSANIKPEKEDISSPATPAVKRKEPPATSHIIIHGGGQDKKVKLA